MIGPVSSPAVSAPTVVATPANDNATKLKSAAQAFEAVFLRQVIGAMRASGQGDGLFDSSATNQFRDMSDARMADDMAAKGTIGIADMLMRQLGPKTAAAAPATPAADPAATTGAAR